jgi:hypothetical protein
VELKDCISIDSTLISAFRNINVINDELTKSIYKDILESYSDEELIKFFSNADLSYENRPFVHSYFTHDALGLIFDVSHVAGDSIAVEIKYNQLHDSIVNNDVWNGYFELPVSAK